MAKKYFWLKLKRDFFSSLAMKKLRRIAGGDTYTIIYLKLQLLSLKDEGYIFYEGVESTLYEEMALALDEDAENVKATLLFLEAMGLIERKSDHEFLLTEVPFLIGSETDKAELMRRKRAQARLENGNNVTAELPDVTLCYTEKEKEKEIENECYARGAFEEFWKAYPRKAGKDAARKAFAKAKVPVATLVAAVERQKKSAQWQKDGGQFIPHPATWLNQGRWQDELEEAKASNTWDRHDPALDKYLDW